MDGSESERNKMFRPTAIEHHSLDWMPKEIWGPIKWKELHCRALIDFPMDKEEQWFEEFLDGLPCPHCRKHFEQFLEKHPPPFENRESFFKWTVDAHNHVNGKLGKKEIDHQEAYRLHHFDKNAVEHSGKSTV
jgi:hypothetical protein